MKNKQSNGQAFIEFIITLPLLLMIIFFLIDLGRIVFYYSLFSNAAREGARYGIVTPLESEIITETKSFTSVAKLSDGSILINPDFSPIGPDRTLTVTITYTVDPITPLANLFFTEGGIDFSTASTMYLEQNP